MFYQSKHQRNLQFIIYYNNDKCLLVFVIYQIYLSSFVIFQKAENNRLKKASWPKFCNIIFLILLKIEPVGSVDQQINLVSLEWTLH